MNQRIKHISFFFALLIAFHFALLWLYQQVEKKSEIVQVFEHYEENPIECKFLFLGASHTKRSIDTLIVKSSYSLAFYGQNNINTYYILKYMLENYRDNYEYICLPNDFGYYTKRASINLDKMFFYKRFFDFKEYGKYSNNYYKSSKEKNYQYYFPYIELREMMSPKGERKAKENKDFSIYNNEQKQKIAFNYIHNEHGIDDVNKIYDSLSITYLKMTLNLLKEHHKKAIFISYPHSNAMQQEINKFGIYKHQEKDLILKAGFDVLDLSETFLKHDEYFFDAHHLNKKGGIHFSHLIQEKLSGF